ncbi:hypothetical protein CCHR01_01576 [Colletotrichum chrysophilum]|uniref:Uncharacterized protein n=1 Tax=Colletotrichum chrysophilum TaxID=1836956 RepID=A0AAD9EP35_9PEZI|nr:hypothetical protein CCHR01_01576 [Colletotrichum chrysophilum]
MTRSLPSTASLTSARPVPPSPISAMPEKLWDASTSPTSLPRLMEAVLSSELAPWSVRFSSWFTFHGRTREAGVSTRQTVSVCLVVMAKRSFGPSASTTTSRSSSLPGRTATSRPGDPASGRVEESKKKKETPWEKK